ncbi:MAG: ATP-binding cassette domain-containing protein [Clostridium sp.]
MGLVNNYININGIKKNFGSNEVLKGINVNIDKGELVCFLGPSGCGKTTLLRIIAGLETMNSGSINVNGRDFSNLSISERKIGFVFQNYALFPNLTIFENIAYGLVNKKLSKDEINIKVNNMLDMVGLTESKDKYPSQISGGQQQRVALARAIVLEPEILLLDEPLSALDAKVRESLRLEIKNLQKKIGVTMILVTHDQEEALTMGDKIVVFNEGKVMQVGTPEELYYSPQNRFTAEFIGTTNVVDNYEGKTIFLRPECLEYSLESRKGFLRGKIESIEFRGTLYRIQVALEGDKKVWLDITWKEMLSNKIDIGQEISVDLSQEVSHE